MSPMAPEAQRRTERARYTVVAEPMGRNAWHITVRELPDTWTVAFARTELEKRARERIALDIGGHTSDFDVHVLEVLPPS
jgi:hypothetical protein